MFLCFLMSLPANIIQQIVLGLEFTPSIFGVGIDLLSMVFSRFAVTSSFSRELIR